MVESTQPLDTTVDGGRPQLQDVGARMNTQSKWVVQDGSDGGHLQVDGALLGSSLLRAVDQDIVVQYEVAWPPAGEQSAPDVELSLHLLKFYSKPSQLETLMLINRLLWIDTPNEVGRPSAHPIRIFPGVDNNFIMLRYTRPVYTTIQILMKPKKERTAVGAY